MEDHCNSWIYQVAAARKGGTSLTFFPLQQLPHPCFPATSCPFLIPNGAHQTGIPMANPLCFCHFSDVNVAAERVWRVLELPVTKEVTETCTETGRRRQQGFPAISLWDLPDSIKSPHAILNYLELHKLFKFKLSLKNSLRRPLHNFLHWWHVPESHRRESIFRRLQDCWSAEKLSLWKRIQKISLQSWSIIHSSLFSGDAKLFLLWITKIFIFIHTEKTPFFLILT